MTCTNPSARIDTRYKPSRQCKSFFIFMAFVFTTQQQWTQKANILFTAPDNKITKENLLSYDNSAILYQCNLHLSYFKCIHLLLLLWSNLALVSLFTSKMHFSLNTFNFPYQCIFYDVLGFACASSTWYFRESTKESGTSIPIPLHGARVGSLFKLWWETLSVLPSELAKQVRGQRSFSEKRQITVKTLGHMGHKCSTLPHNRKAVL